MYLQFWSFYYLNVFAKPVFLSLSILNYISIYVTIISKCFLIVLVVVNSNNTDSKCDVILNYYVK